MRILQLILLTFSLQSLATADPPIGDWKHRAYQMAGEYTVIGRKPDSKTLYFGHLSLYANGEKLDFVKIINHVTVRGTAFLNRLPECQYDVLHVIFAQNGQSFEGEFEFSVDCQNAFRFTGYIGSDNHTKVAGLEAYFPEK